MQYEKRILRALLDSYESSSLSRGENKVSVQFLHRNDQQITSFTATQNKSSNLLWQSIWFILGAAYAIMIKLYQIERNEAMHLWKYSSGGRFYAPMNWQ